MHTKKAFSFVEIIITVSIIALLAVIWISSKKWYDDNMNNTKVVSDVETINNALTSFWEETKTLPMPGGNINFFGIDTSYKHSYDDPSTFWVYGSLTEDTLAKKYLDVLPLDPRTHSYYSYGKVKANNEFEIASIQYIDNEPTSKVIWNYLAASGPYNLIREYNGPNFVSDGSTINFPYNPDELVLVASVKELDWWKNYREWDTISTWPWEQKEIFFSDGSVSILEENSTIILNKLNFKQADNLNTLVKIGLQAWTIWTRATKLNDESEFEVHTIDTTAAVRWTIFWVSKNAWTEILVIQWLVAITDLNNTPIIELNDWESINIYNWDNVWTSTTITPESIPTDFSKNTDPREVEIIATTDPITPTSDIISTTDETLTTCNTFLVWTECATWTLDTYTLTAYAPYNETWDTKMYNAANNIISYSWSINSDDFKQIWDVKWVYIDNLTQDGADYIKYSGLNLGDNFAIEINLKWLNRTDWIYNIFNMEWLDMALNTGKLEVKINDIVSSVNTSSYTDTNFHKIIIKKENNKIYTFTDWEQRIISDTITTTINPTNITIWSKFIPGPNIYSQQWNDVIDYVKIYTR